jgi:hypothetical protein
MIAKASKVVFGWRIALSVKHSRAFLYSASGSSWHEGRVMQFDSYAT